MLYGTYRHSFETNEIYDSMGKLCPYDNLCTWVGRRTTGSLPNKSTVIGTKLSIKILS